MSDGGDGGIVEIGARPLTTKKLTLEDLQRAYNVKTDPNAYWSVDWNRDRGQPYLCGRGKIKPMVEQRVWAIDLCRRLNATIAHDGTWQVIWHSTTFEVDARARIHHHVPNEQMWVWRDQDGDPNLVVDNDDSMADLYKAGVDYFVEQCERAWLQARGILTDVDVQDGQKIKRAQGEQPKNADEEPDL